jgi:Terminase large subunit, ATPase domain
MKQEQFLGSERCRTAARSGEPAGGGRRVQAVARKRPSSNAKASRVITIDRALTDRALLGAALGDPTPWQTWLTVLRAAFGLSLDENQRATFHQVAGERGPPAKRVRELWCLTGRRGGKSRIAAALAVYQACFVKHALAHGEVGHVLVLAASRDQAKVVFDYVKAFLDTSPVLRQEIDSITATEIRLRNSISIGTHANSFRSIRGRTLLAAIFDEVALWRDEVSAVPDLEVYRAVLPALMTTKGMLIGISTPYRRTGLLYQKHRDHFGVASDDVLVIQGTSTQFNPTLTQAEIDAAVADDPEGATSEWEACFRSDLSAFFDEPTIEAAIDRGRPLELPPRTHRYFAFVDPSGGRHDAFTLCIGHREGELFVADVVRGVRPPFDPHEMTRDYAALCREYRCSEVRGDRYSAEWVVTSFRQAGVNYKPADKNKSELYLEALPLFTRGAVSIPDLPPLLRELRLLERVTHRGGKDSVDHPKRGSDDYANALCGCAVLVKSPGFDISGAWVSGPGKPPEDPKDVEERRRKLYELLVRGEKIPF